MESVMQRIRQARADENKRHTGSNIDETIIDGCQVKMRFDEVGDSKVMPAIQAMLLSVFADSAHIGASGGE